MASKINSSINSKEYYRIRKKIGEDMNGKPIIKNFYGKNKTDAQNQIRDFEINRKAGLKTEKEYFGKLIHYWVYEVFMKGGHADGTKNLYEAAYRNYIKECSLSNRLMSELNTKPVQEFFNKLDGKVSPSQINASKKLLALFFKYAEVEGYCRNPMLNIAIKKASVSRKEIVVFNKQDVKTIMESPKDSSMYRFMFLLALGTGLRQGELLGLKYGDIENGKIKVMRQIVTGLDGKRKEDDTKSLSSVRYVPIPKSLLSEFKEYKLSKGNTEQNDYIFCSSSGNLIDKANIIRSWKRFLKRINVDYKEFHTLRRTYCTMLCDNGVPLQVACELMGHKNVTVTAKYYTFVSNKEKDNAADKVNDVLIGKMKVAKKWLKPVRGKIKNQVNC